MPKPKIHIADMPVHTVASAHKFLARCCREIGIGFHPDTAFADYTDFDGFRLFTDGECVNLERKLACCFTFVDDVYAACLALPPFSEQR